MTDHFEVFGLPRKLAIDTVALRRKFYELQKRYHPDFQAQAAPDEQARALETSARLNAAYRALRDPIARVEYLVRLEEGRELRSEGGRDAKTGTEGKPQAPPDLLAEMFEIQEALMEARAGGLDAESRVTLAEQRARLAERFREEEGRVAGPLSREWDEAGPAERPAVLARFRATLATRAYLRTVIDDLTGALGEGEGEHVTHHRR